MTTSKKALTSPYPTSQAPLAEATPKRRDRAAAIPQWSAGWDIVADSGEVRSVLRQVTPKYVAPQDEDIPLEAELDPAVWEVVSDCKSRWQTFAGDWLEAVKVSVRRRFAVSITFDPAEINSILKDYVRPRKTKPSNKKICLVGIADMQLGKIDDANGAEGIINRIARIAEDIATEIQAEASGKKVASIVIALLGDCLEGYASQGGQLLGRLDLSLTEQLRVYRRLVTHIIATLGPLCDQMLVLTVPGNHWQATRQVKTKPSDNFDLEGFSAVADALADRKAYEHVSFLFPGGEEAALAVDIGTEDEPFILGAVHGDVCGSAPNSVIPWWKGQCHGRQAVGEADLLLSGHWHFLRMESTGGNKWWVQMPSLDGGSHWFRRAKGDDVQSGMVTLWITPGTGIGWENLKVHD